VGEFLAMGGYGWYVWMSYGACAVAVVAEVVALRARHRRAFADAKAVGVEPAPERMETAR
jgi:heme exporter protein D